MIETILIWVGATVSIVAAVGILLAALLIFRDMFIAVLNMPLEWALWTLERRLKPNDEEGLKGTLIYIEDMVRAKWKKVDSKTK